MHTHVPSWRTYLTVVFIAFGALALGPVLEGLGGEANAAGPPGGFTVHGTVEVTNTVNANAQVTNDETTPVNSRDVTNPAFQPFQKTVTVTIASGLTTSPDASIGVLPGGKRLVIEHVSGVTGALPATIAVAFGIITTLNGGDSVTHYGCVARPLNVDPSFVLLGPSVDVCTQAVRLYADSVSVFARRPFTPPSDLAVDITISGHLVDLP